jgi:hypothetical protein
MTTRFFQCVLMSERIRFFSMPSIPPLGMTVSVFMSISPTAQIIFHHPIH